MKYTEQIKEMAMNDILKNKMSYIECSIKWGIPKSTIGTWIERLNKQTSPIKPTADDSLNYVDNKLDAINIKLNDILHKLNVLINRE